MISLKLLKNQSNLRRWIVLFFTGTIILSLGIALILTHLYRTYNFYGHLGTLAYYLTLQFIPRNIRMVVVGGGGLALVFFALRELSRSILAPFFTASSGELETILAEYYKKKVGPKIVVIGGGTGTFVALSGLKKYTHNLTAIVSMADDGGSNARIRDELGLLPTSDIRQCIVALATENGDQKTLRDLFTYRFDKGKGLAGHTFGNLFMAALTDITGSQKDAIKKTQEILKVRGNILPVTLDDSRLCARYADGSTVTGEHYIDEPEHEASLEIEKLSLTPAAKANPEATQAILEADLVILGPGDLYTSIISNLVVEDIADALATSKAPKLYILNLMTKLGQTLGYSGMKHVEVLGSYLPQDTITAVLANSANLPTEALKRYEERQETAVMLPRNYTTTPKVFSASLISSALAEKNSADKLVRSYIRHDPHKLADEIMKVYEALASWT